MGNEGTKEGNRVRSQTATGAPSLRGGNSNSLRGGAPNTRLRNQTISSAVTENDFLRSTPKSPTEQDFLTDSVRKRNDEVCSKLALGFAQVDTDRDGFIEKEKVARIYRQLCKLADAVYTNPKFTSDRIGFLEWNNLFKNIPASDKHLAKALQSLDFLSFKDPNETTSTRSYLDFSLTPNQTESQQGETEKEKTRTNSTEGPATTMPPTGTTTTSTTSGTISSITTPTKPLKPMSVVKVHSPPQMTTQSPERKSPPPHPNPNLGTSKPRKSSNLKSSTPSPAPILPTTKRPQVPENKPLGKPTTTGTSLRPPVPQKHRRSRADTGDSDASGVSSVGDVADLDDLQSGDEEQTDFENADADLPKTASPATTGTLQSTTSPSMGTRNDDDDDDTNSSIVARANAVWS